jgi:hypothetical protein
MRNARGLLLVLTVLAATLAGCAHPMTITPEIEKLTPSADAARIPKNVGLYVSSEQRGKQVTTPGGGGDKVSYRPYADMETGIYKMLGNVYEGVTVLHSPSDAGAIAKDSVVYVVEPEITTESSSSGFLTWMATDFTVGLTCKINDTSGHSIAVITASGSGHADFSELTHNFSLAGQRASLDALLKEQALLLQSSALRK